MTPVADNPLRTAAEFIRGLDADTAAAMLGRLSADEARRVRSAIQELHAESQQAVAQPTVADEDGVELRLSPTPVVVPEPEPAPAPPAERPLDGAAWLRSLRDADPGVIASYLSREQPRAIAVVLGYLAPKLAAGVLRSLPETERAKVVAQLAAQGDADPDSLRVIATGLADWVRQQDEERQRRSTRVATIRQILDATPVDERQTLLLGLAESDPETAASLLDTLPKKPVASSMTTPAAPRAPATPQPPTVPFQQLTRLDARALVQALGRLDGRTALLALAAAPDELLKQVTNGLPRATARDLRTRLHRVGPTTLAEIDRAQEALATAAGKIVAARQTARAQQPAGA